MPERGLGGLARKQSPTVRRIMISEYDRDCRRARKSIIITESHNKRKFAYYLSIVALFEVSK